MFLINAQLNLDLSKGATSKIKSEIQSVIGGIKGNVDIEVSSKSKQDVAELGKNLKQLENTIRTLSTEAGNASSNISKFTNGLGGVAKAGKDSATSLGATASATKTVSSSFAEASGEVEKFGHQVGLAFRRFGAFTVATTGLFALVRGLRNAADEAVKFDLQINKLRQVADDGSRGVDSLKNTIQDLSRSLGVSSSDLADAATAFTQAGLSAKDSAKAVEAFSLALLSPNFGDAKNTIEGMIALYQQFGKDADKLKGQLGSINAVAGAFASEAEDLVTAIQKAGGVFSETGGKLEELLGIMTSVRATTRESADSIATGLRSIFTYIQRTETVDTLKQLNINLRRTREEAIALGDVNLAEQFVGPYEAIQRLSAGLAKLRSTDPRYSQIVEDLGGVRQVSRVLPLIKQFAEAQKAVNVARVGSASIETAAAIRQDALITKLTKVRETYQQLANDLVQSRGFKELASVLTDVATKFADVARSMAPLLPVLSGLAIGQLAKFSVSAGSSFLNTVSGKTPVVRRSTGGPVPGQGNGDTVPAYLEPNEFVIKKASARKLGQEKLNYLNDHGELPRFANGGGYYENKIPVHSFDNNLRPRKLGGHTPIIKNVVERIHGIGLDPSLLSNGIVLNAYDNMGLGDFYGQFRSDKRKIGLNNTLIKKNFPTNYRKSGISTLAHEFGHGLDDLLSRGGSPHNVSAFDMFASEFEGYSEFDNIQKILKHVKNTGNEYLDSPSEKFADTFGALLTGISANNRRPVSPLAKLEMASWLEHVKDKYPQLKAPKLKGYANGGQFEGTRGGHILGVPVKFGKTNVNLGIINDIEDLLKRRNNAALLRGIKFNDNEDYSSENISPSVLDGILNNNVGYNQINNTSLVSGGYLNSVSNIAPALNYRYTDRVSHNMGIARNHRRTRAIIERDRGLNDLGIDARSITTLIGTPVEKSFEDNIAGFGDVVRGLNRKDLTRYISKLSKSEGNPFWRDTTAVAKFFEQEGNGSGSILADALDDQGAGLHADLLRSILEAGQKYKRYASGGPVFGGIAGKDSVNARLMPEEFVIKASSAKKIGHGALDHINKTGELPRGFAKGGSLDDDGPSTPFRLPDEAYEKRLRDLDATANRIVAQNPELQKPDLSMKAAQLASLFKEGIDEFYRKMIEVARAKNNELNRAYGRAGNDNFDISSLGANKALETYKVTDRSNMAGFLGFVQNKVQGLFSDQFDRLRLSKETMSVINRDRQEDPLSGSSAIGFLRNKINLSGIKNNPDALDKFAKFYHLSNESTFRSKDVVTDDHLRGYSNIEKLIGYSRKNRNLEDTISNNSLKTSSRGIDIDSIDEKLAEEKSIADAEKEEKERLKKQQQLDNIKRRRTTNKKYDPQEVLNKLKGIKPPTVQTQTISDVIGPGIDVPQFAGLSSGYKDPMADAFAKLGITNKSTEDPLFAAFRKIGINGGSNLQGGFQNTAKNVYEIVKDIEQKTGIKFDNVKKINVNKFGTPDASTKYLPEGKSSVAGSFQSSTGILGSNSKIFSNQQQVYENILHELGHAFDHKIGKGEASSLKEGSTSNKIALDFKEKLSKYFEQTKGIFNEKFVNYALSPKETFANAFKFHQLGAYQNKDLDELISSNQYKQPESSNTTQTPITSNPYEGMSIRQIAKLTGVPRSTIQDRLKKGMSIEQAVAAGGGGGRRNKSITANGSDDNNIPHGPDLPSSGMYPLAIIKPIAALPPYTAPSMKYALPGGQNGGPGGFIIGDPTENPATRGLKQEEKQFPVGYKSMFGLNLNGWTPNYINTNRAFGLKLGEDQKFDANTLNSPSLFNSWALQKENTGKTIRFYNSDGTIQSESGPNAGKPIAPRFSNLERTQGFADYTNYRMQNSVRGGEAITFRPNGATSGYQQSPNLEVLRGTSVFEGVQQKKYNEAVEKLARGIDRQLKALNLNISATEREAASHELAANAYKTNQAFIANNRGEATGLKSLEGGRLGFIDRGFNFAEDVKAGASRRLSNLKDKFSNTAIGRGFSNIGQRLEGRGVQLSLGLSTAASFGAEALGPNKDLLSSQVQSGDDSKYRNRAVGAGGLQGAAIGASIGLAAGPYGAVIGGVVGGLVGLTSALKQARIDIQSAKIDVSIQKIGESIRNVSSGRDSLSSINEAELSRNIRQARSSAYSIAGEEAGYGNSKTLQLETQKQLRVAFGGQAGNLAAVLAEEVNRESKKEGATVEGVFGGFQGGARKDILETLSEIRGISKPTAERELKEDIRLSLENAKALKANDTGENELKRLSASFDRLALSVNNASVSTNKFKDNLEVISGNSGSVFGLGDKIQQFGVVGSQDFNQGLSGIGNILGSSGSKLVSSLNAANQLQSVLPEVLAEVASQGLDEKETPTSKIAKLLEGRVDTKNPEIAAAIAVAMRGLAEETRKNNGETLRDAKVDPSLLAKQLLSPFTNAALDSVAKIAKDTQSEFNFQLTGNENLKQRKQESDYQRSRGFDLSLNTARSSADILAEQLGGGSGGRLLSYQQLLSPFNGKQNTLLSGLGVSNAEDPNEIRAKLAQTLSDREEAKRKVNEASISGDSNAFKKATENFSKLGYDADRLQKALQNLIDPTQKLAAIQERLSHLREDEESRLSFGERFINADSNERQVIARGQRLVADLAADPSKAGQKFLGLNNDNQRLALREARSIGQGQFQNGLTGNSLANLLIRSTGVGNTVNDKEKEFLLGEKAKTDKTAEEANNGLSTVLETQNQNFKNNLDKSLKTFLDQLKINLLNVDILNAENNFQTAKGQTDKFSNQNKQAELLKSVGIGIGTTSDQIDNSYRVGSSREAKDALEKFFAAKNDFLPYQDNNASKYLESVTKVQNSSVFKNGSANEIVAELDIPNELKANTASIFQKTGRTSLLNAVNVAYQSKRFETEQALGAAGEKVRSFGYNTDTLSRLDENQFKGLKAALDAFQSESISSLPDRINKSNQALDGLKKSADALKTQFTELTTKKTVSFFGAPISIKKAAGGSIFESRGSDTVPAMLTPEEFVINARSAKANRGLLEAINNGNGQVIGPYIDPGFSTPVAPNGQSTLNDKLLSRGGPVYLAGGGKVRSKNINPKTNRTQYSDFFNPPGKGVQDERDDFLKLGKDDFDPFGLPPIVGLAPIMPKDYSKKNIDLNQGKAKPNKLEDLLSDYNNFSEVGLNRIGKNNNTWRKVQGVRNKRQIDSLMLQQALQSTDDEIYQTGIDRLRFQDEKDFKRFDGRFGSIIRSEQQKEIEKLKQSGNKRVFQFDKGRGGKGKGVGGNLFKDNNGLPRGFLGEQGQAIGFGTSKIGPNPNGEAIFGNKGGPSTLFGIDYKNIGFKKFAAGGVVTGGIPGQDSVPALLTPGEVVVPNKGGSTASDKMTEQNNKLATSINSFVEPANKLTSSFTVFAERSDALIAALDRFPREITHTGSFEVHATVTGAEAFSEFGKKMEAMVDKKLSQGLNQELERRFPEAASKLKSSPLNLD